MVNEVQEENALSSIDVILSGRIREVNEQPEKVPLFILVILLGRVREVNEEQKENALSFIEVILSGSKREVNEIQEGKILNVSIWS